MPTTAPVKQTTYKVAPEGTHVARVVRFINLGTRFQEYKGERKAYPDTLVRFTLELPNELDEFEYEDKETGEKKQVSKPFVISREFTLSMGSKSNLRPFVEGVIGTSLTDEEAGAFDIETLVGKACQATVKHVKSADGSRTYANLNTTAPLMKGVEAPAQVNESIIQDVKLMSDEEIDKLPDFLQEKIKASDEWKERFDEETQNRRKEIGEQIKGMVGTRAVQPEEEINPEDIPFK